MQRLALIVCLLVASCDSTAPSTPQTKPTAVPAAPVATVTYTESAGQGSLAFFQGDAPLSGPAPAQILTGTRVVTDHTTRARLTMSEAQVVVSHATSLTFAADDLIQVTDGRVLIENGKTPLRVETPAGILALHDAKASVVVLGNVVNVTVSRGFGEVQGKNGNVLAHPGMRVRWVKDDVPKLTWSNELAAEIGWSDDVSQRPTDAPRPASGLGKLVGKQPNGERERPLEMTSHKVTARVQGNVAYTEIHEVFRNPTGETLEGLYRFPLPADAQIASLSLKVGDRWMDGEFMETARAERIFRDVIDRYLDPALLQWKQGNQFELRIFPILPKQVREVKIGYVQTLRRSGEGYRYTYPMPVDVQGQIAAGKFEFDGKFYGVDAAQNVSAEGYAADVKRGATQGDVPVAEVAFNADNFVAAGDFTVRFARPADAGINVYTHDETIRKGEPSYALVTVRPDMAAAPQTASRDFVVIADTSYSRHGAVAQLQGELVGRLIAEMDPQDRVAAMACATTCAPLVEAGFQPAEDLTARQTAEALGAKPYQGTFNAVESLRVAERLFNARPGDAQTRKQHIILLTDGAASAGAVNPATLSQAASDLLGGRGVRMTVVNLGGDTDETNLQALVRGTQGKSVEGVVVHMDPAMSPSANALEVLRYHYGALLTDIRLTWPDGVTQATGPDATTIAAGDELTFAARFSRPVSGDVLVSGTLGGVPFEQRVRVDLKPSTAPATAFVPRKWAAMRMAELDGDDAKRSEIIALSVRYGVLSRYTALLALEDNDMMDDYGVRRHRRAELAPEAEEAPTAAPADTGDTASDRSASRGAPMPKPSTKASRPAEKSESVDMMDRFGAAEPSADEPAKKADARPRAESKSMKRPAFDADDEFGIGIATPRQQHHRPYRRRAPSRLAKISAAQDVSAGEKRAMERARETWQREPENRTKRMAYIRALLAADDLAAARQEVKAWLELNAMDAEALVLQGQVRLLEGDPESALTWLESGADAQPRGTWVHDRLATAYEASGRDALACYQRALLGDVSGKKPQDALACPIASDLVSFGLSADRLGSTRTAEKLRTSGDIKLTWTGDQDVTLVVMEPSGRALSWLSQRRNLGVSGVGFEQQTLVLPRASENATYSVRVIPHRGHATGKLLVESVSARKEIQVRATSNRSEVAEVRIEWGWTAR